MRPRILWTRKNAGKRAPGVFARGTFSLFPCSSASFRVPKIRCHTYGILYLGALFPRSKRHLPKAAQKRRSDCLARAAHFRPGARRPQKLTSNRRPRDESPGLNLATSCIAASIRVPRFLERKARPAGFAAAFGTPIRYNLPDRTATQLRTGKKGLP